MTYIQYVSALPALLIALAGRIALHRGQEESRPGRFLLLMLGTAVVLLAALVVAFRLNAAGYHELVFQLPMLLISSLVGVLALILLNGKHLPGLDRRGQIRAGLLAVSTLALFGLLWGSQGVDALIWPGVLILTIGWALGRRDGWLAVALALVSLGMIVWMSHLRSHPPDYAAGVRPLALPFLFFFGFNVWPGLAVVLSGALLAASLRPPGAAEDGASSLASRRARPFAFALACLLLLALAHAIFWGSVWDQTDDGLWGVLLAQYGGILAVGTGMIMTVRGRGKIRLAGPIFLLLVPVLLHQSFEFGWQVSYHEITERRAERTARALARFQAREGRYPETLQALTPLDLLWIQQPVLLAGEGWCYQGTEESYRLGAFYREFFSSPVSIRVYESAGGTPAEPWACEARLAEMKERHPSPMEDPAMMQPPQPTPLPEIEVSVPKTEVRPLLDGARALPGRWSPDGAYFVFGTQAPDLRLHFLNGTTGAVCTVHEPFPGAEDIRSRHAWLPDGRLLYLNATGEMVILTPCQSGMAPVPGDFSETFSQMETYSAEHGRILLRSESAYWLLDIHSLDAQPIPGVTPNPYEFHWDNFAWLPGGERLAIARLNGRDRTEGSTLYLIAADSGEVMESLPLAHASDQSAPWIEGLPGQALLVHGQGDLLIVDFSADPPEVTNVLADLFGLDADYPNEVSAAGSFIDPEEGGYYLAVRLNHPRNQATYLYDSETGGVHVYEHENHTLLLFPDGQMMELARQETLPDMRDEYDVVRVEAPEASQPRLVLTGHTPREYPHLRFEYLAGRSQLAVGSRHGVSLVSLPDGELLAYWELTGEGFLQWLTAAPDGTSIVAVEDYSGLYHMPLTPGP